VEDMCRLRNCLVLCALKKSSVYLLRSPGQADPDSLAESRFNMPRPICTIYRFRLLDLPIRL
jgi:hypothetical protein